MPLRIRTDMEERSKTLYGGVPIWNPLDHGIQDTPLMVPCHHHTRIVALLVKALSLAHKHVPIGSEDDTKIRELEQAATNPYHTGFV